LVVWCLVFRLRNAEVGMRNVVIRGLLIPHSAFRIRTSAFAPVSHLV